MADVPLPGGDWTTRVGAIGGLVVASLAVVNRLGSAKEKRLAEEQARIDARIQAVIGPMIADLKQDMEAGHDRLSEDFRERHLENVRNYSEMKTKIDDLWERRRAFRTHFGDDA